MTFCQKKLGLKEVPTLILVAKKEPDMSTACYNGNDNTMKVLAGNRLLIDVMRSVAHELTHRCQDQEGRLSPDMGYDETNPMADVGAPYENEANARAGALVKEFSRVYDGGLGKEEIFVL
jgi:hypothetical protein